MQCVPEVPASDIAHFLDCDLIGDDVMIGSVVPLPRVRKGVLSFAQANASALVDLCRLPRDCFLIADQTLADKLSCSHVLVENPRFEFARTLWKFFVDQPASVVSERAHISETASLGKGVGVGCFSVVEDDVVIGEDTIIGDHVVLKSGVRIGRRCTVMSHVVIGETGFGLAFDGEKYVGMPHLGGVRIGDDVQINCRASIDRGTLDDTVVGDHVKIGTQVRIAHNVLIDQGAIVAGGVSICGSSHIGKSAWIGPGALIRDGGLLIGEHSVVGMGAVVTKSVDAGVVVVGNPAKVMRKV